MIEWNYLVDKNEKCGQILLKGGFLVFIRQVILITCYTEYFAMARKTSK